MKPSGIIWDLTKRVLKRALLEIKLLTLLYKVGYQSIAYIMMNDDGILLRRVKTGDLSALELIFKKYAPMLCVYAHSITKDQQAAEDAVQQVFTRLLSLKKYNGVSSNLKAYLYVSVYHRTLRMQDEENRRKNQNIVYQYVVPDREEIDLDMEYSNVKRERLFNHLDHLLTEMPPQRRQAIKLVYLEGYKYNDAAAFMGISINSLKTHLKEALKSLRKNIQY